MIQDFSTADKRGYLRLGFELDSRRSILRDWERHAPTIVQQALYFDEEWEELPCVYILSSGGPALEGDRYRQRFTLAPHSYAHISTGAATKVAPMREGYCSMQTHITLAEGAYLEYLPEPLIPCRDARYTSCTEIEIAPTASLLLGETILCGRKHSRERFDYSLLLSTISARRPSGEVLFSETSLSRPKPTRVGEMGGYDVRATVYALCPKEDSQAIYSLFNPVQSADTATALTTLPNDCGLRFIALGHESGPVKHAVREFFSLARLRIKGRPLPAEFAWR